MKLEQIQIRVRVQVESGTYPLLFTTENLRLGNDAFGFVVVWALRPVSCVFSERTRHF